MTNEKIDQLVRFTKAVAYISIVWGDIAGIILIVISRNVEYAHYLDNMVGLLMAIAGLEKISGIE